MTPILKTLLYSVVGSLLLYTVVRSLWSTEPALAHPDPELFAESAFIEPPNVVDCTLQNGAQTQCYEFVVRYLPEGLDIGPFCPQNLDDTGGIWDWDGDEAELYQLDRTFFEMLADQGYRFYDANENIIITNPGSGSRPEESHTCLEALPDERVLITMRLPVSPVMADSPSELGTVAKVGVALDGVPIFADAPSVLTTGHLPALDSCGGHIDPGGWYHWHATSTDIKTATKTAGFETNCALPQNASLIFGYAFDGFPMFGSVESDGSSPSELDKCHGHNGMTSVGNTYHYHASTDFPNLPLCLSGVVAKNNFATTASNGIGSARGNRQQGNGGGMPPDFQEAADKLNLSAEELMNALGGPGQNPNLAAAAAKLGISEDALRTALPPPPDR